MLHNNKNNSCLTASIPEKNPGKPVSECQVMMDMVTNGTLRRANLQSDHHHQHINSQLLTGWISVAQPAVSKH